jgi:hypothetical protein
MRSLSLWTLLGWERLVSILQTQPVRDLVGVEADGATDAKARELTPRGHSIDVLIVHSQEFGQVRDLHRSVPGFQFLYQVETHADSSKLLGVS